MSQWPITLGPLFKPVAGMTDADRRGAANRPTDYRNLTYTSEGTLLRRAAFVDLPSKSINANARGPLYWTQPHRLTPTDAPTRVTVALAKDNSGNRVVIAPYHGRLMALGAGGNFAITSHLPVDDQGKLYGLRSDGDVTRINNLLVAIDTLSTSGWGLGTPTGIEIVGGRLFTCTATDTQDIGFSQVLTYGTLDSTLKVRNYEAGTVTTLRGAYFGGTPALLAFQERAVSLLYGEPFSGSWGPIFHNDGVKYTSLNPGAAMPGPNGVYFAGQYGIYLCSPQIQKLTGAQEGVYRNFFGDAHPDQLVVAAGYIYVRQGQKLLEFDVNDNLITGLYSLAGGDLQSIGTDFQQQLIVGGSGSAVAIGTQGEGNSDTWSGTNAVQCTVTWENLTLGDATKDKAYDEVHVAGSLKQTAAPTAPTVKLVSFNGGTTTTATLNAWATNRQADRVSIGATRWRAAFAQLVLTVPNTAWDLSIRALTIVGRQFRRLSNG